MRGKKTPRYRVSAIASMSHYGARSGSSSISQPACWQGRTNITLVANKHRVRKKGATILLPLTLSNATDFQNSFTDRLSSKVVVKQ